MAISGDHRWPSVGTSWWPRTARVGFQTAISKASIARSERRLLEIWEPSTIREYTSMTKADENHGNSPGSIIEIPHPLRARACPSARQTGADPSRIGVVTHQSTEGPTSMLTQGEDVEAQALRKRGWSITAIANHLGRDRKTIRAYLSQERQVGVRKRSSSRPRTPTCMGLHVGQIGNQ